MMLRGAFIGFGHVAATGHLPGWCERDDVTMVAAVDVTQANRQTFYAACPEGHWYNTFDQLVDNEAIDFVDICTPPGSHAELIQRSLGSGLHVLCEKPLLTLTQDAIVLREAQPGRVVQTVHNWLNAPICHKITALVASGAVGTVHSVRWRTLRTKPAVAVASDGVENWRIDPVMAGGGILFDHGWHALYCVLRWMGEVPQGVRATLENRCFTEWPIEDTATLELDGGTAKGNIFLTWTADERANHIEVEGNLGRIHVEGCDVIVDGVAGEQRWPFAQPLSAGSHHPEWFTGVVEDFCTAIADGTSGNLHEALLCARLIGLAQLSSARHGTTMALGD